MKKMKKKKGFTLIELIVVIAIIGILAAIAIPRFAGMQGSAKVKAEGSTAAQIVSAARIQESEAGAGSIVSAETAATTAIKTQYMTVPAIPEFKLNGGGAAPYVVTWASNANGYTTGTQKYEENVAFVPTP